MRVTVNHSKSHAEAVRAVEGAVDELARYNAPGIFKVTGVEKRWEGSTLHFRLNAAVGPFRPPMTGAAHVTDREIVIEAALPMLLARLVSEQAIQNHVEARVRGLLRNTA